MPLVTETAGCLGFDCWCACQGLTHWGEEQAWYAVSDGIGDVALMAMESFTGQREARAAARAAQGFQQRLYRFNH